MSSVTSSMKRTDSLVSALAHQQRPDPDNVSMVYLPIKDNEPQVERVIDGGNYKLIFYISDEGA